MKVIMDRWDECQIELESDSDYQSVVTFCHNCKTFFRYDMGSRMARHVKRRQGYTIFGPFCRDEVPFCPNCPRDCITDENRKLIDRPLERGETFLFQYLKRDGPMDKRQKYKKGRYNASNASGSMV